MKLSKKQNILISRILDDERMIRQRCIDEMEGLKFAIGQNALDEIKMIENVLMKLDEELAIKEEV